ncbi:MAG: AraC family transcriptional regulator [Desertifilum sp. SIO1I2]|nr:AraC family transcriptional regulator [Desertifilum sp. SIO1I2]
MPEAKPRAIASGGDLIQICDRSPILTSLHAGWNGIFLGHFRTPAYESPEVCSPFWHGLLIELSIAEVAYSVGFANQSHLNRHLKRLLGVTPRHIRQR